MGCDVSDTDMEKVKCFLFGRRVKMFSSLGAGIVPLISPIILLKSDVDNCSSNAMLTSFLCILLISCSILSLFCLLHC